MKTVASLALLATLASACTLPRHGRTLAVASGAVVSLAGMAAFADADVAVDSDGNGLNDNPLNDNWGDLDDQLAGMALVGLGLALIVAGATAKDPPEATIVAPPATRRPASVTWTPEVMPYDHVPGMAPGMSVEAPPSPAATRAALPEVATDDVALRMAQQARAAALRGECDAAWRTWSAIDARDPRYAAALASGPVLAPCPRPLASEPSPTERQAALP